MHYYIIDYKSSIKGSWWLWTEMVAWIQAPGWDTKIRKCQTSSDFTHLGDGRLICGDAAKLLVVWCGCSWQPQHQRKQTLVPAKGLFGQLAACQRRVQRQVQLDNRRGSRKTRRMFYEWKLPYVNIFIVFQILLIKVLTDQFSTKGTWQHCCLCLRPHLIWHPRAVC